MRRRSAQEADRAWAGFLRAIQRDIGMLENIVWCFAVAGRQTYADAGSADDLVSLDQERILESGDNLPGQCKYLIQSRDAWRDQSELVATDARNYVGIPGTSPEPGRKLREELIARKMTALVVHLFETIEVEQKNGTLLATASQPDQGGFQAFVERDAVRQ